jgi:hypothetical protein
MTFSCLLNPAAQSGVVPLFGLLLQARAASSELDLGP